MALNSSDVLTDSGVPDNELSPIELVEHRLAESQRIAHIGSFEWDIATGSIWSSDETYHLYDLNPEQYRLTFEEFVRSISLKFRAEIERRLRACAERGAPFDEVFSYETRTRKERWMRCAAKLIRDGAGHPLRVSGTMQDLTALRIAQQQLRRTAADLVTTEQGLRRVLDDLNDYIVRFDADGSIRYANDAFCNAAGRQLRDLFGASIAASELRPDYQESLGALLKLTPKSPSRFIEAQITTSSGETLWIEWVDTAVYFDDLGQPSVFQSTGRDISAHIQMQEELHSALLEVEQLRDKLTRENRILREQSKQAARTGRKLVGDSNAMSRVRASIATVASTGVPVLITGETGTGKELAAEAVHAASSRSNAPLVKVNCAALTADLVESELFGHVKGAFTGAVANRKGRFELAHKGTLFLDEIGELPLETQAKILRAIENGSFERVGASQTVNVDVRIIAATNRDLDAEANAGRFREDLYWRLNVYPLAMPPLRDRRSDIPVLIQYFFELAIEKHWLSVREISDAAMVKLVNHDWPGNVRELRNTIERAAIAEQSQALEPESIEFPRTQELKSESVATLDEHISRYILRTLERANWVVGGEHGAARLLGINESTLRSRMRKLGIDRRGPRTGQ